MKPPLTPKDDGALRVGIDDADGLALHQGEDRDGAG
jgi:hypothetical protein